MSHKQTAYNQIKRYGYKGAAVLNANVVNDDKVEKTRTVLVTSPIPLLAYVHRYPQAKINGDSILVDDRRVLIALDNDFDGTIGKNDTLTVDGIDLTIVNKTLHRINETVVMVEVKARG